MCCLKLKNMAARFASLIRRPISGKSVTTDSARAEGRQQTADPSVLALDVQSRAKVIPIEVNLSSYTCNTAIVHTVRSYPATFRILKGRRAS